MRISAVKNKSNSKMGLLGLLIFSGLVILFVFFNRHQVIRSVAHVNGGSILNDFLDAKCKFNEFFAEPNDITRRDLVVEMGSSNYVKIQKERAKKTKDYIHKGGMIRTQTNYYKADVVLGGEKSKSKVGLFGGASDNFRDSNGFHFRIKFNGKEKFGKKMYNVLKPRSRGFNIDKLANTIHKEIFNGLEVEYEPVNVIFNKVSFGVYLTEEYFDKYLIESKEHRESFIFKTMSKDSIKFKHIPDSEDSILRMNLISQILENPDPDEFSKLIDREKMFGYLALGFIFNQQHSSSTDNLHFFYNSVTNKLEPIVREMHLYTYTTEPTLDGLKSVPASMHFLLKNWMEFVGAAEFESGIKKAVSKMRKGFNPLLVSKDYLDYKVKLGGYSSEMERNENVILNNLKKLEFLNDYEKKQTHLYELNILNDTLLTSDLIIGKNEKLTIMEGVSVSFVSDASLFIYGGLSILGSVEKPISLKAIEGSTSSIYINSEEKISVRFAHFKNLSALTKGLWQLPSAITAYESNADFSNCTFASNKMGDDMVNFFRCKNVTLNDCIFNDILSDAIDTDFSNVEIQDNSFESIGNDAIDGSGSKVLITNCTFSKIEDKAISAGEASIFETSNNKIFNSELGLVCKDGSTLISENDTLARNKIDLVMFVKKDYYGQPSVTLNGTKIGSNLIEKKVEVTGLNIPKNISKGVKDKLYGNEFGKSSK